MQAKWLIILVLGLAAHRSAGQSARELLLDMIDHCNELQGFEAEITKEERFADELIRQVSRVKLARNPFRLYLYQLHPKEGLEVLCRPHHDKVVINLNAFPWINLYLNPYGAMMRKNQHHVVFDSGFDLFASIVRKELARIGTDTARHLRYLGLKSWDNRPAYLVEMRVPEYDTTTYTVQEGEDLMTIARKLNLSEYAILEMNEEVDFYDDVTAGQQIRVPTHYASRILIYIDREYKLPLLVEVYDPKGLYERYAYRNFVLNPPFSEADFSTENESYGF